MLIDYDLVLSDAQAVTASAASDSYIDQLAAGDAYGNECFVEFLIDTTFTPNSATIVFALQCDDNTSFSSPKVLYASGALADTALVAGYRAGRVKIPLGAERYLRAYYTVSGTAVAGKIDCRIVKDVDVSING
jgi:hypothetical protein